jgi:flavin-dependent dehydrogenase
MAGPGWAAAGDAAASFDPLSSMGIGHALWSGTHAARLAEDVLLGPSSFAADYNEVMQRQYQQYLQLRRRYYRLERRWPDRAFWRGRHGVGAEEARGDSPPWSPARSPAQPRLPDERGRGRGPRAPVPH